MLFLTVDALRGGFWGFSALVSGVTTCSFYAPEIMVAVFLRVAVSLEAFALYYLFLYKRWFDLNYGVHQPVDVVDFFVIFFFRFISMRNSESRFFVILCLKLLMLVTSWPCFNSSNFRSSRSTEWWILRSTTRNGLSCLS